MGTIQSLIEYWLLNTVQKAIRNSDGTEWWLPLGRLNDISVCAKLQWEPGYGEEPQNPFIQQGYALTVGLFEEYSSLLVCDWRQLTDTSSMGPDQIDLLVTASWLARRYKELEKKGGV